MDASGCIVQFFSFVADVAVEQHQSQYGIQHHKYIHYVAGEYFPIFDFGQINAKRAFSGHGNV